jgi:hypothetical protein
MNIAEGILINSNPESKGNTNERRSIPNQKIISSIQEHTCLFRGYIIDGAYLLL